MDPIVPYNRPGAKLFQPDEALAAIVGNEPIERPLVVTKLWKYIKVHKLQNKKDIKADEKLLPVFNGQKTVTMFDLVEWAFNRDD